MMDTPKAEARGLYRYDAGQSVDRREGMRGDGAAPTGTTQTNVLAASVVDLSGDRRRSSERQVTCSHPIRVEDAENDSERGGGLAIRVVTAGRDRPLEREEALASEVSA